MNIIKVGLDWNRNIVSVCSQVVSAAQVFNWAQLISKLQPLRAQLSITTLQTLTFLSWNICFEILSHADQTNVECMVPFFDLLNRPSDRIHTCVYKWRGGLCKQQQWFSFISFLHMDRNFIVSWTINSKRNHLPLGIWLVIGLFICCITVFWDFTVLYRV